MDVQYTSTLRVSELILRPDTWYLAAEEKELLVAREGEILERLAEKG